MPNNSRPARLPAERRRYRLAVPVDYIEKRIFLVRNHRVMLANDLAPLYGVTTFNLNKAVKRNRRRFPADFMFQLLASESDALTFQIGISKPGGRGGRRSLPYAFTEEGVSMLSSVLRSERAVNVNIMIMRAFVRLRAGRKDLAQKVDTLEKRCDARFRDVWDTIRKLMNPPKPRRIGFAPDDPK